MPPTKEPPVHESPEPIDQRLVRALSHPLRVQILELLADRMASPNWLSEQLEASLSHVAYHTRALHKCGCLTLVRTEPRRGATEHFYKATPEAFVSSRAWRRVPRSVRGGVSAATLRTFIDKAIAALEAGTLDAHDDTVFRWMPLRLDQRGWEEVVAILEEATEKVLTAHLASQDRLSASDGAGAISTLIGLASFETAGSLSDSS
jgi:DNA-binding transcriptional ArsR family regulator